jgi:hypothetical protein
MEVPAGTIVRVGPEVARSVWNEGPDDAVLIMVSKKIDDPGADIEQFSTWVRSRRCASPAVAVGGVGRIDPCGGRFGTVQAGR